MTGEKKRSSEILPITLLLLCVILFFSQVLSTDHSLYGSDFLFYFYQVKRFIRDCLFDNTFPFWNPYLFSGSPFISNIQASMFYPLGFFYYFFQPETAYLYSTLMHCILGGIFMYLFMRSLLIPKTASFFAALIFMFNGYFMGHLFAGHLSFVQNYIWMPLIFLFLLRFLKTIDFINAFYTGSILGIQILGGFPQVAFYTILSIIIFGIFYLYAFLTLKRFKDAARIVLGLGIIILVGFSLSAVQILPTLEFSMRSTKAGGVTYDYATYHSLHPKELLSFLLPEIFGNVVDGTYWRTPEFWHFWETCAYVGIIPFLLVYFKPQKESLRRIWFFFIIMISVSLFLALGKYNPFYHVIYKLPGFNSFRIPAQIIYLYVFSVSVLSGLGIASLDDDRVIFTKGSVSFLALIGVILSIFIVLIHWIGHEFLQGMFGFFGEGPIRDIDFHNLYKRTRTGIDKAGLIFFMVLLLLLMRKNKKINFSIFSVCLLFLSLMDLGEFGWKFITPYDYSNALEKKQIVSKINNKPFEGRIIALPPFGPNDGLTYKFPSILGYDPLILKRYVNYIQASQNWPQNNNLVNLDWINYPDTKLLKMLNVNKLVHLDKVVDIENDIPYVNFITESVIKNENEILNFMQSDEFDPKTMLVFDSKYSSTIPFCQTSEKVNGSFSVLEYGVNRIRLNVSVDKAAYLIFSEIYYPGWKAIIDGNTSSILCGNYIFRVIPITSGLHEINMYFISWPFRIGCLISLLTLISGVGYLLYRKLY